MSELSLSFTFFFQPAGFDIGDALLPFESSDTYVRAFAVGLVNTLVMAGAGITSAMLLGIFVGIGLVVGNRFTMISLRGFVEMMRNLPKLLILLALYIIMVNALPVIREAFNPLPGIYLSNRGLNLPGLDFSTWSFIYPEASRFGFQGGWHIPTQFIALWLTLTIYHGAQIGEIVRGGLLAIPRQQWEASAALGFPMRQRLQLVILPQVLHRIIPSLISQFINLLKNTSIGLAVGFTDLMAVASTTINQAFKPVEVMLVIMLVYLTVGLVLATALNLLNTHARRGMG